MTPSANASPQESTRMHILLAILLALAFCIYSLLISTLMESALSGMDK